MRLRVSLIAVLTSLAACSPPAEGPADRSGASSAPTNSGAASSSIEPGQYRTTVTVLGMTIPGIKQSQVNMAPTTTEDCVTSSDIADFTRGSMIDADEGETCTQNSMNTAGGHIEGVATCTGENGARTMHITGTYTSNHVEMDVNASGQMPGGAGEMTQHIRVVTDRIGACSEGTN